MPKDFQAHQIPIIVVPASIDNNLPCTAFSVGADTALNNIVDAVDKIGHTAGAISRTFIVEVMGRQCGFLALMGRWPQGLKRPIYRKQALIWLNSTGMWKSLKIASLLEKK